MFKLLEENQLKLNLHKCEFFSKELCFLGFIIWSHGMKMDPKKTEVLQNWPTSSFITEVRIFMGLTFFYRIGSSDLDITYVRNQIHGNNEMQAGMEATLVPIIMQEYPLDIFEHSLYNGYDYMRI